MTERKADYLVCGARSDNCGLGSMAEDFCRNMPADAILINPERKRPLFPDRISNVRATFGWDDPHKLADLIPLFEGYKAVVFFETFVNAVFIQAARDARALAVGFPMWECSPAGFQHLDLVIALSDCEEENYPDAIAMRWPIDIEVFGNPPTPGTPPMRFIHNAGNLGIHYRNATKTILDASWGLFGTGTGVKIKVRSLERMPQGWAADGKVVEYEPAPRDRQNLYSGADVLLALRRFGGDSLPIAEATALGLPVIVSDISSYSAYPMRVPCREAGEFESPAGFKVQLYDPDGAELAEMISAMARGNMPVEQTPDRLKPPTWDQFKRQFQKIVR